MRKAIGYRESPDGGTRHVHFSYSEPVLDENGEVIGTVEVPDPLPEGWRLIKGEEIPGPDPEMLKAADVQQRLRAELPDLIIDNADSYLDLAAAVAARRAEIGAEVTDEKP